MGLLHSPLSPTDGLVLCLDSANRRSYPGSGNTWFDLSGNGNNGTLTNGVNYNGFAMNFDGSNDVIPCTSLTQGNLGSSDATISLWARLSNISVYSSIICKRMPVSDFRQWSLTQGNVTDSGQINPGKHIGIFWFKGGSANSINDAQCFRTTNDVVDGNWHHILIRRRNGFGVDFYIDGINVSVTPITNGLNNINADHTSSPVIIGSSVISGFTAPISGQLDDIRIYNRALSPAEIGILFNSKRMRYGL